MKRAEKEEVWSTAELVGQQSSYSSSKEGEAGALLAFVFLKCISGDV